MTEPTDAEHIPHTCGGFSGTFYVQHKRMPSAQEIWDAAIRSYRDLNRAPPAVAGEHIPEWAKPHPRCDAGCMFQCTKGFAEFPSCSTTPQPTQAQAGAVPLTDGQIDAAAKKLAECMEYPWEFMPEPGRKNMRKHAQDVIEAAHGIKGGRHGAE